jgi:hypothetical protein
MANVLFAAETLSKMGSRQLEQVIFRFNRSQEAENFPNAEWIKVDTILASPQFATLKSIRITVPPDTIANLSVLFTTLLPTCHTRGILSIIDQRRFEP